MKFKTPWNAGEFPKSEGEKNYSPSMTVPDQSMSISEIMSRYARGLPMEGVKVPIYDEENDLPDPKTMDLAERQEYMEMAKDEISLIKEKHAKVKPKYTDTWVEQKADDKEADKKTDTDKVADNTNLS